jgi:hypothetical protein
MMRPNPFTQSVNGRDMTTIATIALVAIALGVGLLCILSYNTYLALEKNSRLLRDIKKLQLNPRTRISTIEVQSGPVDEIQEGRRVARASVAKRVVVGGDSDSELNENLSRTAYADDDEEE